MTSLTNAIFGIYSLSSVYFDNAKVEFRRRFVVLFSRRHKIELKSFRTVLYVLCFCKCYVDDTDRYGIEAK